MEFTALRLADLGFVAENGIAKWYKFGFEDGQRCKAILTGDGCVIVATNNLNEAAVHPDLETFIEWLEEAE